MDFTTQDFGLNNAIKQFQGIGFQRMAEIDSLTRFDKYVLKFFYEGITPLDDKPPTPRTAIDPRNGGSLSTA